MAKKYIKYLSRYYILHTFQDNLVVDAADQTYPTLIFSLLDSARAACNKTLKEAMMNEGWARKKSGKARGGGSMHPTENC